MAIPNNILQQVQTYQMSGLAFLENLNFFISESNKKFKDFDKIEANLGDTVTFEVPPRFVTNQTLVVTFQPSAQRVETLTVDQAENVSYAFSAQQFIFNVDEYMDRFGMAAMKELGASIESNVAQVCETSTFRFFGDGLTAIDSFDQLAQALAFYRNFGAPIHNIKGVLDDLAVPAIIGTGLNQFALDRNNEIAQSWRVGRFSNCDWNQSNLLPLHVSGNVGKNATVLTVTATTTNAAGEIIAITFSGAGAGDSDAIKENDLLQFQDGVAAQPNLRFLTFIGHKVSGNPVQLRATADAASDGGGVVTISIDPFLIGPTLGGSNQNLNADIAAGQQIKSVPDHRCGLLIGGDALFLAMPKLPEEVPYPTASETDPETGASLRMYYGSRFGENIHGFINDCIWGKRLVANYAMRLVFPA